MSQLRPHPLTPDAFASFGEVIEAVATTRVPMNDGRFERFDALARVQTAGPTRIGIVRALVATELPHRFDVLERHLLSTQAFIPRDEFRFVVVVARPGEAPDAGGLVAFVSNGRQGINYHAGTWHMPLIALARGNEFLVIDSGASQQTETHRLDGPVTVTGFAP